jgi:hypothetical protein
LKALALLALMALAPAIATAAPSSKGCDGFTGLWTTQWTDGGPVNLTINGTSGTYDWKDGKVSGTINGSVFAGTYGQSNQSGTFQFTLSGDGNAFTGWYEIDGSTDKVDWNGTCAGPVPAPAPSPIAT